MRNVISIRSVSGLLVIVCLLTSIATQALGNYAAYRDPKKVVVTRNDETPTPSGTQTPFEEKEMERDGEPEGSEDSLFFIRLTGDATLFAMFEAGSYYVYEAPRSCAGTVDIPLYLSNRTFLI